MRIKKIGCTRLISGQTKNAYRNQTRLACIVERLSRGAASAGDQGETIVISWVMVVGAVMASLALGVLVAYGICQAMFRIFRLHALSAAESRSMAAAVSMEAIVRN